MSLCLFSIEEKSDKLYIDCKIATVVGCARNRGEVEACERRSLFKLWRVSSFVM